MPTSKFLVIATSDGINVNKSKIITCLMYYDVTGKESKTVMMVQVSPDASSVSETNCSLSFAQRVRAVQLN